VTIKDVALRARVSIASVSRALQWHRCGHRKDAPARWSAPARQTALYATRLWRASLITRRTNTIGVLLPDIYGEYFSELIRGHRPGRPG